MSNQLQCFSLEIDSAYQLQNVTGGIKLVVIYRDNICGCVLWLIKIELCVLYYVNRCKINNLHGIRKIRRWMIDANIRETWNNLNEPNLHNALNKLWTVNQDTYFVRRQKNADLLSLRMSIFTDWLDHKNTNTSYA